jgi:hypothetical protein
MPLETDARFFGRNNFEKLLLARGRAHRFE